MVGWLVVDQQKSMGKRKNTNEDDPGLVTWSKLTSTAYSFAEQKRQRIYEERFSEEQAEAQKSELSVFSIGSRKID